MNPTLSSIIKMSIGMLLLCSCGSGKNANDTKDPVNEFDTGDVLIGSIAHMKAHDGKLLIEDARSTDKLVKVFNPATLEFIGEFADFGPGPDEIATAPGNLTVNEATGELYMFDYGQMKIAAYDIDSALTVEGYRPHVKQRIDMSGSFPDRYIYINDTTGFGRSITLSNSGPFSQDLCHYNLSNGTLTPFGEKREGNRSIFGVNARSKRLAEGCLNRDMLVVYDLEGNVINRVKGDAYSDAPSRGKKFYTFVLVTDKNILTVYSGREAKEARDGSKIIVYDLDGNNPTTIDTGRLIQDMEYDPSTGRLFMAFDDEMQFGYIELDKLMEQ